MAHLICSYTEPLRYLATFLRQTTLPSSSSKKSMTSFKLITDDFIDERPPLSIACCFSFSQKEKKFLFMRSVILTFSTVILHRLFHCFFVVDDNNTASARFFTLCFRLDFIYLGSHQP